AVASAYSATPTEELTLPPLLDAGSGGEPGAGGVEGAHGVDDQASEPGREHRVRLDLEEGDYRHLVEDGALGLLVVDDALGIVGVAVAGGEQLVDAGNGALGQVVALAAEAQRAQEGVGSRLGGHAPPPQPEQLLLAADGEAQIVRVGVGPQLGRDAGS